MISDSDLWLLKFFLDGKHTAGTLFSSIEIQTAYSRPDNLGRKLNQLFSLNLLTKETKGKYIFFDLTEIAKKEMEFAETREKDRIERDKQMIVEAEKQLFEKKSNEPILDDDLGSNFMEFMKKTDHYKRLVETLYKGKKSFKIKFTELELYSPNLAEKLLENPKEILEVFTDFLSREELPEKKVFIRITDLPPSYHLSINALRTKHLGKLVEVEGIIRRASEVRPEVVDIDFQCFECNGVTSVLQTSHQVKRPSICPKCFVGKSFKELEKTFADAQLIQLEQAPENLVDGEQPSRVDILLHNDLVEPKEMKNLAPGQRIKVVGILREKPQLNKKQEKIFDIYLLANSIESSNKGIEELIATPEEIGKFKEMASLPDFWQKFTRSIAPSVFGHEKVKEAIALQMFGGVQKEKSDGTKLKGVIDLLLVGDPGAGKSMLLKYAINFVPRGMYINGKGASGAGLTAVVVKDEFLGGWTLEAGAVVLMHKGMCAIDEFDKMQPEDRSAMHEVMSVGQVSVHKANIHANLKADTTLLCACNPKASRYDIMKDVVEQIDLPDSLLTRFDLIFAIVDKADENHDTNLARHILSNHFRLNNTSSEKIDTKLMKKYIFYAQSINPEFTSEAGEVFEQFYVGLRRKANGNTAAPPISARSIDALIRLSEAKARSRLSSFVTKEDAGYAIGLMTYCLNTMGIDPETGKYDANRLSGGLSSSKKDRVFSAEKIFEDLAKNDKNGLVRHKAFLEELIARQGIDFHKAEEIIKLLHDKGEIYEVRSGEYKQLV